MSAPAAGGRVVVVPTTQPVLLTEYASGADAPLYVINSDPAAARVWLGADSGVGPNSGVPLDAGTALPWTARGQLYASVDPGAAAPVTLTLSSALGDWSPSPAALGAIIAARLLATGVPSTLLEETRNLGAVAAGQSVTTDITGWASVIILTGGLLANLDDGGNVLDSEIGVGGFEYRLVGTTLRYTNLSGVPIGNVRIVLTNRAAPVRVDFRNQDALIDTWSQPFGALVAGTEVFLTHQTPNVKHQGRVWATFNMTPATAVTGYFVATDGDNGRIILAHTSSPGFVNSAGYFVGTMSVGLPPLAAVSFIPITGGSSQLLVNFAAMDL